MRDIPEELADSARPASIKEYNDWLIGYLSNGGEIRHFYDRPFETAGLQLIEYDASIPPRTRIRAIVPKHVTVESTRFNQTNLFHMEGYHTNGNPALYADNIEDIVRMFPEQFHPPTVSGLTLLHAPECVTCPWEGEAQNTNADARAVSEEHADGLAKDHLALVSRVLVTDSGMELYRYR